MEITISTTFYTWGNWNQKCWVSLPRSHSKLPVKSPGDGYRPGPLALCFLTHARRTKKNFRETLESIIWIKRIRSGEWYHRLPVYGSCWYLFSMIITILQNFKFIKQTVLDSHFILNSGDRLYTWQFIIIWYYNFPLLGGGGHYHDLTLPQ